MGTSSPVEDQKTGKELPLAALASNPFQPRRTFDPTALEELAESIRRHGVLQPIVVRPVPGLLEEPRYEIISGERRWRASKLAGRTSIPVTVRTDVPDDQLLELALVENLQRQDLDAIERATGYQQMMQTLGITQEQVAEKVGLKRVTVTNHLRLLELPAPAQEAVRRNLISMGHARALLGLADKSAILGLVERIARQDLSVREVERLVRQSSGASKGPTSPDLSKSGSEPWVRDLEERMRHHLGTKVELHNGAGYRGQIVIEYFNRSDLDRLCALLAPRQELR